MTISVRLLQPPSVPPIEMASHAAKMCYNPKTPVLGETMNVKAALFNPGHHTTFEHTDYTFVIEGIAVGDITLGFHLCSPFYNSDQRSGRYCTEMFANPDVVGIAQYIRAYYPSLTEKKIWEITDYVEECIDTYNRYKDKAAIVAEKALRSQRPHYPEQDYEALADKIAQEQMRVLIPVIMPTAFDYSVNLTTIVALYKSAFTPVMRAVTAMMADLVTHHDPRTRFMFVRDELPEREHWMGIDRLPDRVKLVKQPTCRLLDIDHADMFQLPSDDVRHPVDQLHFLPEMMDNSIGSVTTELTLSLMTMGQNQRHRTVHRGSPRFTGGFYLAPLLSRCKGLPEAARSLAEKWVSLSQDLPPALSASIAPYGAMVTYVTKGDFNALIHEHGKRGCFNAQEEVYHLSTQLRAQIIKKLGRLSPLVSIFNPPCYNYGKCLEGKRYCGREINLRLGTGNYFPRRVA